MTRDDGGGWAGDGRLRESVDGERESEARERAELVMCRRHDWRWSTGTRVYDEMN
jgi:hypothetical protein